eukprot:1136575-Karenia_brevis.AAC.1
MDDNGVGLNSVNIPEHMIHETTCSLHHDECGRYTRGTFVSKHVSPGLMANVLALKWSPTNAKACPVWQNHKRACVF